jgi:hypothetical protein
METNIKAKIDTINLNIRIQEDLSIITQKKNYEMIELYPRLIEILEILEIPKEKFRMRDKKVSSKVVINQNAVFLEFKTIPPRPGEVINHTYKNCHIQIKGEWLLQNGFQKFIDVFNKLKPDSASKIEIAFDFIHEKSFLKDTMNIFLNFKDKIKKFGGENKIILNMTTEVEESLNYFNASKMLKIYNKAIQLKNDKKKELYYEKNPDFLNQNHYRVELSLMKSSIIEKNLKLIELINNENTETEIIYKFIDYYFKDFSISKTSSIKSILKLIENKKILF